MGGTPAVLILDDGELDDIQEMLFELNIPCARIRGGAIVQGSPPPEDLLIATPRRIGAVEEAIGDSLTPPIRVMVVNEDSTALRDQLRRSGFDYLVRRPVHEEALRLLLLHCVYKGEERRREPRVAVGFEITFRTGLLTRRATLVDLSIRGCRLRSRSRVDAGRRIKVQIPEALDTGDPLTMLGRVVRLEGDKEEDADNYVLGISFDTVTEDARQAIELLIEDRAIGPAKLRSGADDIPRPTPAPTPTPEPAAEKPRRERKGGLVERQAKQARRDFTPPPAKREDWGASSSETPHAETTPAPPEVQEQALPQESTPVESAPEATPTAEAPEPSGPERRRQARGAYPQTVPAFSERALRVLVGRDISTGGMRIENVDGLEIGDRLHLAIYGGQGEEPLLVWGRVHRDDGEDGHAIVFEELDESASARLERIVTGLPSFEALHRSEAEAMGTVVSRIIE
ncbi:MAG: PilZ domain-containing protein [Myxococcota bacterium]